MKIISIIAEYNPFHNGHSWQIAEAKKRTGADFVLVIQSGDFVQRGEPALLDKFTRANMALLGGADLILELPVRYAAGSAEYFARGACSLLFALQTDLLCFGCETEKSDAFSALAELLYEEPETFRIFLRQFLASGNSFPKARLLALEAYFKELPSAPLTFEDAKDLLSSPNNTLGLEYLIACKRLGFSVDFLPIERKAVSYHSQMPSGCFASATAIRNDPNLASSCMPSCCQPLFQEALLEKRLHTFEDYSRLLHYALLMENDYTKFLDVNEDLSDRIRKLLPQYRSFSQFVTLLKTKQMTEARIRRALLHILLGIQNCEDRFAGLSYARVLGFRKSALPLLSEIKKRSSIHLLTKAADAKKLLSPSDYQEFLLNVRASDIYHTADTSSVPYNEYQKQILRI